MQIRVTRVNNPLSAAAPPSDPGPVAGRSANASATPTPRSPPIWRRRNSAGAQTRFGSSSTAPREPPMNHADRPPGGGIRLTDVRDLGSFFDRVDVPITPFHLAAGGSFAAVAAILVAAARRQKIGPRELLGSLDCDPLAALVTDGVLSSGNRRQPRRAGRDRATGPRITLPNSAPSPSAPCPITWPAPTRSRSLSFALATGIEYLRNLTDRGFEPGAVCRQIGFRHAVGRDLFMEAAKLRACRRLWARAAGACGVGRGRPRGADPRRRLATNSDHPRSLGQQPPDHRRRLRRVGGGSRYPHRSALRLRHRRIR